MRGLLVIGGLLLSLSFSAQHVIKVKKSQTITGLFYWQDEDKTRDYLLFTEEGYVYILENTKKKQKKASAMLESCATDPNCNEIKSKDYTFEKNVISFSYGSTTYVKDYNGTFESQGEKIVFKISETDELMVVREYDRVE
jgi:hypothetical protein